MELYTQVLGETHTDTILFLSGFVGSHRVWDENFRALSAHFRLVLVDSLGFGQSPKPDIEYSVAEHVAAITATLQRLGVTKTHVVGHSMGCLLALALTHRHPDIIERMSLLALPLFENEAQARRTIEHSSLFNRWLAMDTPLGELACRIMCRLRPLLIPIAPRIVKDVPTFVAKDALLHNWHSYSRTLRNVIFRSDAMQWLRQLEHEVLLIHGTHDTTAPLVNVQKALPAIPRARLVTLDANHGLIFSHSATITAALREFFVPARQEGLSHG
jgi:pimeloyl-ACP methyl ester carboxylesterase